MEEIKGRIETLEDMLDETSVEFGNPELIAELAQLKKKLEKGVRHGIQL